jgi:hypothetical protein
MLNGILDAFFSSGQYDGQYQSFAVQLSQQIFAYVSKSGISSFASSSVIPFHPPFANIIKICHMADVMLVNLTFTIGVFSILLALVVLTSNATLVSFCFFGYVHFIPHFLYTPSVFRLH